MKTLILIFICIIHSSFSFSQSEPHADSIYQKITTNLIANPLKNSTSPSESRLIIVEALIANNRIAQIQSWNESKSIGIKNINLLFKGLKPEWLEAYNHKKLVFMIFILNQTNGNDEQNNLFFINDFNLEYMKRITSSKMMVLMKPIIINTIADTD